MPGEGLGHFFGAMRIDAFQPKRNFKANMDNWIKRFRSAQTIDGQEAVLVPGDPERIIEQERINSGFELLKPVENDLKMLAEKFELTL
jgi:LDH2 family malate/lactate/ureidoglycolate dehydrogenase